MREPADAPLARWIIDETQAETLTDLLEAIAKRVCTLEKENEDLKDVRDSLEDIHKEFEEKNRDLLELRAQAAPIAEYYEKRAAWDGGSALPSEPSDGEKLDFRVAYQKTLDR